MHRIAGPCAGAVSVPPWLYSLHLLATSSAYYCDAVLARARGASRRVKACGPCVVAFARTRASPSLRPRNCVRSTPRTSISRLRTSPTCWTYNLLLASTTVAMPSAAASTLFLLLGPALLAVQAQDESTFDFTASDITGALLAPELKDSDGEVPVRPRERKRVCPRRPDTYQAAAEHNLIHMQRSIGALRPQACAEQRQSAHPVAASTRCCRSARRQTSVHFSEIIWGLCLNTSLVLPSCFCAVGCGH